MVTTPETQKSLPRTSGDDPVRGIKATVMNAFAPHKRG